MICSQHINTQVGLAQALAKIISSRSKQSNFQLITITHDEVRRDGKTNAPSPSFDVGFLFCGQLSVFNLHQRMGLISCVSMIAKSLFRLFKECALFGLVFMFAGCSFNFAFC